MFWLWCRCFKCVLLSLWCLGRKVLGNCIDSWTLLSFLSEYCYDIFSETTKRILHVSKLGWMFPWCLVVPKKDSSGPLTNTATAGVYENPAFLPKDIALPPIPLGGFLSKLGLNILHGHFLCQNETKRPICRSPDWHRHADMQMLCNIFPILSSQLMKRSSFKQFLILKKNIYGMTVNGPWSFEQALNHISTVGSMWNLVANG